jgi:hypothetical protein
MKFQLIRKITKQVCGINIEEAKKCLGNYDLIFSFKKYKNNNNIIRNFTFFKTKIFSNIEFNIKIVALGKICLAALKLA